MATAWITEYDSFQIDNGKVVEVLAEPAIADQEITFTTAVESAAFSVNTHYIRIYADAAAHIQIGPAGTATATIAMQKIAAETEYVRRVNPGEEISLVTA